MTHPEARTSRRAAVGDAVVLAVMVVVAGLALGPAYGGTRYLAMLIVGAVVGAAAALLPVLARWSVWATVPALVVGYLVFGVVAVPAAAAAGWLPTLESVRLLVVGVVGSWKQMLTVAVPVGESGALLVPAFLSAMLLALVAVLLALRTPRPGTALLAPLAMGVAAASLGSSTPAWPAAVGTAVALLALAWLGWRRRRAGGAGLDLRRPVAIGAVLVPAVAVGLLVGPSFAAGVVGSAPRTVARAAVQPAFNPQDYPSPLAGFRTFVKQDKTTPLFTVTGLPAGQRIRLAVLDSYDGVIYSLSPTTGVFRRVGDTIADVPAGTQGTVTFTIDKYRGVWLPSAGYLAGARFSGPDAIALTDAFRYNDATGTGALTTGTQSGDSYTFRVSFPVVPDAASMAGVAVEQIGQPAPTNVPEEIKTKAAQWTAGAKDDYGKATALATALKDGGYFSHGDDGALSSPAGHGADRMVRLLSGSLMVGDQEQYSVAMALMARSLGMPARVVMGFVPTKGGTGEQTITGSQVSAWVEIPFAGVGWVAFDPTPDQAKIPQQHDQDQSQSPKQQQVQPPPPPEPPKHVDPKSVQDSQSSDQQNQNQDQKQHPKPPISAQTVATLALAIGIPLVVLVIPVLVLAGLKSRRRRRRRRRGPPSARIAGGWYEIVDTARDFGYPVPLSKTRTEAASGIDDSFGTATAVLAGVADARTFAPEAVDPAEPERFWAEVDAALLGMSRSRSFWRRVRARLSPRSLRRRR